MKKDLGQNLLECSDTQIKSVFDDIAFNDNTDENLQEAIRLFARLQRDDYYGILYI